MQNKLGVGIRMWAATVPHVAVTKNSVMTRTSMVGWKSHPTGTLLSLCIPVALRLCFASTQSTDPPWTGLHRLAGMHPRLPFGTFSIKEANYLCFSHVDPSTLRYSIGVFLGIDTITFSISWEVVIGNFAFSSEKFCSKSEVKAEWA